MIRRATWLLIVLLGVAVSTAQNKPETEDPATRWEKTIREFEDWDRKNSYPSDAVLFVGSSSIRMWPTRECFAGLAVINRGFGGSQISDVNYYTTRIVLPYKPRVIVFYAGDNDIAAGKNAEQVFNDYKKFVQLVHQRLPNTRIIFVSIKPSGSRWSLWPVMSSANTMIKAFSEKNPRLFYFDGATPLLDSQGKPNLELFRSDQLHLNPKGYEIWTRLLRPVINGALKLRKPGQ
jgi:lysophospholipase L1-like esterase